MANASPDPESPDPESSDPEFSDPGSPDPFSSPSPGDDAAGFEEAEVPPWETEGPEFGQEAPDESFAVDMARLWVKQHQKATMLGAFGVGVFVGALLRD
jgi:hypothetical protein